MTKKIKRFISDFWSVSLAIIIMGAGMVLDYFGVEGAKIFGVVAFIVLSIYQAVMPRIELNKLKAKYPNIIVRGAYPRKNVETVDFVYYDPKDGSAQSRYSGGTVGAWEYKPAIREKYGTTDNSEAEIAKQTYIVIDFVNEPEAEIEGQDAVDVVAKLKYKNGQGKYIFSKEIKGLWQGNEPSRYVNQKQDYEYTQMTLPANGDERSLCIAIKNVDDEDCFAYTLESYQNATFLKRADLCLGSGVILVEVYLSGKNLKTQKPYLFRIVNPGKNRDVTVNAIS
jgi:hypothetical protein